MSNYVKTIRAEWLAAGWSYNPMTRQLVLRSLEQEVSALYRPVSEYDGYVPATLLNTKEIN